jgi:hypothetical protein
LEKCPYCGIEIDYDDILPSIYNRFVITQAISSANNLQTLDAGALIFAVSAALGYFSDLWLWYRLLTIAPAPLFLLICLGWFAKHGRWDSNDPDYLAARQKMKKSLRYWALANVFILLLFVAAYKDHLPFLR